MSEQWLTPEQQQAWRAYLLGTIVINDRLERELDNHGLSLAEYEIFVRLSEAPGHALRMAELADSVRNSRSRITHTIRRLERSGYVVRRSCESDGRGVLAVLTDAGFEKLTSAAPDHVASVRAALVDVVSPDDLATIGRAFTAVIENAEAGASDPLLCPTA